MDIEVTLLPKQIELLNSEEPFTCMLGGLGSSKTHALVVWIVDEMVGYPGSYGALASRTYPQLMKSTVRELLKYCAGLGIDATLNRGSNTITIGTSVLNLLTLDINPNLQKGPEYDFIAIDEADSVSLESYERLADRAGRTGRGKVRLACNPVSPGHWIAKQFSIEPLPGHKLIRMTTYDNKFLSPEYIRRLESRYPKGTIQHRRWMLADFVTNEGVVYPEFNEDCIFDDEPTILYPASSVDLGTRDPTVILAGGLDILGNLIIRHEWYASEVAPSDRMPHFRELCHGPTFIDHEPDWLLELQKAGIHAMYATKDVLPGIEMVRDRFRTGTIKIHRSCTNLITELYNYTWSTADTEKPDHKFSHAPDALRYLTVGMDIGDASDTIDTLDRYIRS